jgi:hypothetical protein
VNRDGKVAVCSTERDRPRATPQSLGGTLLALEHDMSWRTRRSDLLRAGGTLASGAAILTACGPGPDPCAGQKTQAETTECDQRYACRRTGGSWTDPNLNYADGRGDGAVPRCIHPDAGVDDAPHD